jgi:DNA primase
MPDFITFLKEVKAANNIVSVIGSYIELKQRGQQYWARCPFHGEKTPSFSVNERMQIYKCFGCGESGDVIKFVEKYESCTTMEALEILAKRANIEIPLFHEHQADNALSEKKKKRDTLLKILRETARFYYKQYHSTAGSKAAFLYMQNRGFTIDTVKKFGIGFSPNMDSLVAHLTRAGFSQNDCLEAGVLQKSTKSDRCFDALSGRLIVPIFDINKNVIAFGGRALDDKTSQYGKYKNTSETTLFLKKNNLYGINFCKEQKQQANLPYIVVVEGYMDVIAMAQAGFLYAVASMGTSLTSQQAKLISRLTDNVYICYDGDAAGQKATVRGMDILAEAGLNVKVMSVPDNLDPDEYINKHGVDAFKEIITAALPLTDYKLKILAEYFHIDNGDSDSITKFTTGAVGVLKKLDDVARAQYVKVVSRLSGLSEDFLTRKITEKVTDERPQVTTEVSAVPAETSALYFIANAILTGQPYAKLSQKPHTDVPFLTQVYDYIFDCYSRNEAPTLDMVYSQVDVTDNMQYNLLSGKDFTAASANADKQYFAECVRLVTIAELKRKRKIYSDEYAREGLSPERQSELLTKIQQLNDEIATKERKNGI